MKKLLVVLSMILLAVTAGTAKLNGLPVIRGGGSENAAPPALPTEHRVPTGSHAEETTALILVHARFARHVQTTDRKALLRKKTRASGNRIFVSPSALALSALVPGIALPASSLDGKAWQPGPESQERAPPLST